MKYFLDTEFIEGFHKPLFGKRRHFIDLMSIGIVCEDGREYYAISKEYNYKDASHWVRENVIAPMYLDAVHGDARNRWDETDFQHAFGKSNAQIAEEVRKFFGCWRDQHFWRAQEGIEVYGYYADYDWVLFCSLFGRMIDLPKGFPMYCRDLKQIKDEKAEAVDELALTKLVIGSETKWEVTAPLPPNIIDISKWDKGAKIALLETHSSYPKQANEHNALSDARWNKALHDFLLTPISSTTIKP